MARRVPVETVEWRKLRLFMDYGNSSITGKQPMANLDFPLPEDSLPRFFIHLAEK